MRVGEYYYEPHGRHYRICQCNYSDGKLTVSNPVQSEPLRSDKEEARKRVYELNGWEYKAKSN